MAKVKAQITLFYVVDIKASYRYYLLQASTLAKPSKPTSFPPSSTWSDSEPTYTQGSTNSLYFVDCTVFADDTYDYSEVSLSTAYEAAKEAYNKAQGAQDTANNVDSKVDGIDAATKDVNDRLAEAEAMIEVLTGAISMIVTDTNGTTLLQQSGSGWSFNLDSVANNVNTIQTALNNLTDTVGDVNTAVSQLDQTVTQEFDRYRNHIDIGTYYNQETGNDEPCIKFHETENNLTVIVTNQRILMQDGTNAAVDISESTLKAENVIIKNTLKQGGFAWVKRSSGTIHKLGLLWEGVDA